MPVPLSQLFQESPSNYAHFTGYTTATDKPWAKKYPPITELVVHTSVVVDEAGKEKTIADWDTAMLPSFDDDRLRLNAHGERPNRRRYRLDTESDMALWFHTEVSNVVLAAWNDNPAAVQSCEAKPWTEEPISETVDVTYSLSAGDKPPLAIGEFKRNLINVFEWRTGNLRISQRLSRELRGYADKYKCPQIFCFDGETLLLLQFRADNHNDIARETCQVDCWVLPRENAAGGCTLRDGLHRLLVQGFRRCQGLLAVEHLSIKGYVPQYRELYSGRPVFCHAHGMLSYEHPETGQENNGRLLDRQVDANDGSFYWRCNGQPMVDENNCWNEDAAAPITWHGVTPLQIRGRLKEN
ncbi:hypothetical protein QBC47DRAFT_465494 [Echria macrotheca]|uniref:Uncharacterized protein n=1 Tax=Echria macrotheca TaxID=438768 RepID=A0AAJ0B3P0_9PEZI|nr:hypothetical protein QBC47DRAFT_465494 [Echria macrotheca]